VQTADIQRHSFNTHTTHGQIMCIYFVGTRRYILLALQIHSTNDQRCLYLFSCFSWESTLINVFHFLFILSKLAPNSFTCSQQNFCQTINNNKYKKKANKKKRKKNYFSMLLPQFVEYL